MLSTVLMLHRSEGPAQVFLLVLNWLVAAFGNATRDDWRKIIVSYDNMCHLNNLKVAKEALPLPGDLKYIWLDVRKIIDSLHLRNHKDDRCKSEYDPANVLSEGMNTMSCEQTFAWLSRYVVNFLLLPSTPVSYSRYKKILSAMPKIHHHFYLHRMVKRRNEYISRCYELKRRPLRIRIKGYEN